MIPVPTYRKRIGAKRRAAEVRHDMLTFHSLAQEFLLRSERAAFDRDLALFGIHVRDGNGHRVDPWSVFAKP